MLVLPVLRGKGRFVVHGSFADLPVAIVMRCTCESSGSAPAANACASQFPYVFYYKKPAFRHPLCGFFPTALFVYRHYLRDAACTMAPEQPPSERLSTPSRRTVLRCEQVLLPCCEGSSKGGQHQAAVSSSHKIYWPPAAFLAAASASHWGGGCRGQQREDGCISKRGLVSTQNFGT